MTATTASTTRRWVSCSREADPFTARHRHLVTPGGITTACGATASMPDVWRGNTTKPPCPSCERESKGNNR